jgi:hypothetical protein
MQSARGLADRPNHAEVPDGGTQRSWIAFEDYDPSPGTSGPVRMCQPHNSGANNGHIRLLGDDHSHISIRVLINQNAPLAEH